MVATYLVVGATGNTGQKVVTTLPKLLGFDIEDYRIIALTRSLESPAAKKLAEIPRVQVIEKDWTLIDAEWLREHGVVRAFVASHNLPSAFVDESLLLTAMLEAKVQYVVRISTTTPNVHPDTKVYYARTHWAIENLLSQPEYQSLQWSSLQPNVFTPLVLGPVVAWVTRYRETGKVEPFSTLLSADNPSALVHPDDVGIIGAHLLAEEDTRPHNQKRYVVNGPEDMNGKQLVALAEEAAGVKVQEVEYADLSWMARLKDFGYPENVIPSLSRAANPVLDGRTSLASMPTSKELLSLAPPRITPAETLKALLEG